MFVPPVGATGEPNKHVWVCVMWHGPGSQKGDRRNLAVKCCHRMIGSVEVKIPVLINIKPLEVADELSWDKASAKTLMAQRLKITTTDTMQSFDTANKKRKVCEHRVVAYGMCAQPAAEAMRIKNLEPSINREDAFLITSIALNNFVGMCARHHVCARFAAATHLFRVPCGHVI